MLSTQPAHLRHRVVVVEEEEDENCKTPIFPKVSPHQPELATVAGV